MLLEDGLDSLIFFHQNDDTNSDKLKYKDGFVPPESHRFILKLATR